MSVVDAILLGIVEGITEFLPISSTAHLVLASTLLGIEQTPSVKSFEIAIQLGAIGAVLLLYGGNIVREPRRLLIVLAGFIPTALIGFFLYRTIKLFLLGNVPIILWALAVGSLMMIAAERAYQRRAGATRETLSIKDAVMIGVVQSLAVIPGVSRSGATIVGGLCMGIDRRTMVEYSFLLAIPTMASAVAYDLFQSGVAFVFRDWIILAVGFVTALVTALVAVRWFLHHIERSTFNPYAFYRLLVVAVWLMGRLPLA